MLAKSTRSLAIVALMALFAAGCGDDGGAGSVQTTASAAPGSTAGESGSEASPSLTLLAEEITGSQGQLLVAVLSAAGRPVGSVCIGVDADPFSGSGVFSTFDPNNPCGKDAPYGEVITEDATYAVTIGVVTPGETVPSLCADATATISGPSELRITGADLASDCTGF